MLRITELLPAGDIPKPLDALALQWYYMSYHKSDRKKFVLSGKTLKDVTVETVTTFFQALYKQKKLDGSLDRQEFERLKKRLLPKAAETSIARCVTPPMIAAPITPSARSRVAMIGDATTSTATKIIDDTLTTIATTTVTTLCAEC